MSVNLKWMWDQEGEEIKDASGVSGLECLQRNNDGLGRGWIELLAQMIR